MLTNHYVRTPITDLWDGLILGGFTVLKKSSLLRLLRSFISDSVTTYNVGAQHITPTYMSCICNKKYMTFIIVFIKIHHHHNPIKIYLYAGKYFFK